VVYLLSDLRTRFRSLTLTNSTAYGHYDADRQDALLNDAQLEVYKLLIETHDETYFVALTESISPVAGEVNLDTALVAGKPLYRLICFEKLQGSVWRPVTIGSPREAWRQQQGSPEVWWVFGHKLKTNDGVSGTYRVAYHYRIPRLSAVGDATEIPDEFAEMIPLGAAKMAALQARQKDDAAFFDGEWEKRKREMKASAANRNLAKQMRVVDVGQTGHQINAHPGIYIVT
jgi:hypothetical protein